MSQINAIHTQLDNSSLFRDFPSDSKQALLKGAKIKHFSDGQCLYQHGDMPTMLFGVLQGVVKLVAEDIRGNVLLYQLAPPGHWFGEISILDGAAREQNAIVVGDCELLCLSRNTLIQTLEQRPELYRHFIEVLCRRVRLSGKALRETAFLPVDVRVARMLLRLQKIRNQHNIKLSQSDLAATLGMTRQSIYRTIKDWKHNGWVSVEYGDIHITHVEMLKQLVNTYGFEIQ